MFTGIIEALGNVREVRMEGSNKTFRIASGISGELRPDQSVAHNGVCLTVEDAGPGWHQVTAIEETLIKSNLDDWKPGSLINLERSLLLGDRLDGHLVQGHVDSMAVCTGRLEKNGSTVFNFQFPEEFSLLIVEKGSVSLNGISLTIFETGRNSFSVAIIPYTILHTNLSQLQPGNRVNIEFDLLGKYVQRYLNLKDL